MNKYGTIWRSEPYPIPSELASDEHWPEMIAVTVVAVLKELLLNRTYTPRMSPRDEIDLLTYQPELYRIWSHEQIEAYTSLEQFPFDEAFISNLTASLVGTIRERAFIGISLSYTLKPTSQNGQEPTNQIHIWRSYPKLRKPYLSILCLERQVNTSTGCDEWLLCFYTQSSHPVIVYRIDFD